MLKQKKSYIPQVLTSAALVDVTSWNAATSFTTEAIEFASDTAWALDVEGWAGVTAVTPTLTILHSNKVDGEYNPYSALATSIDLNVTGNRVIFDEIFPARYMKIQYVSGGSTGTFSLNLSK